MTIVEFTGCTGAGKTRLCHAVRARLRTTGRRALVIEDCLRWGHVGEGWLPVGIRNRFQEIALRGPTREAFESHPQYRAFVRDAVRRYADSAYFGWRAWLGVRRQMGSLRVLSRSAGRAGIGLMDEGPVHTAYYVLVQLSRAPAAADMHAFARLVPLPDLIVLVTAPREVVLERFTARPDPRRRGLTDADIARLVDHGRALCDALVRTPELSPRVLEVATSDDVEADVETVLAGIRARTNGRPVRSDGGRPG